MKIPEKLEGYDYTLEIKINLNRNKIIEYIGTMFIRLGVFILVKSQRMEEV